MSTSVRKPNLIGNPSLFKTDLLYSSSPASVTTRKDTGEVKFQGSFTFTAVSNATGIWNANSNLSSSFATAFNADVVQIEDAVATLGFGFTTIASATAVFKASATLESSSTLSATCATGGEQAGVAELGFGFTITPTAIITSSKLGVAELTSSFSFTADATEGSIEQGEAILSSTFTASADAVSGAIKQGEALLSSNFTAVADGGVGSTQSGASSLSSSFSTTADANIFTAKLGEASLSCTFTSTQNGKLDKGASASLEVSSTITAGGETATFGACSLSSTFTSTSDATLIESMTNAYSIDLDGTDDFMRTPICAWNYDGAGGRLFGHGGGSNLEGFSIQQYMKFDALTGVPRIFFGFTHQNNVNKTFQAGIHQGLYYYTILGSAGWAGSTGHGSLSGGGPHGLSTDQWHHIVSTWEPTDVSVDSSFQGTLKIYIDNASPANSGISPYTGRTFDNDDASYAITLAGVATLDSALDSSSTGNINITMLSGLAAPNVEFAWHASDPYKIIQIGTERIKVGGSANASGVISISERGVEGTTAQAHASGAEVVSDNCNLAFGGRRAGYVAAGYQWTPNAKMDEVALWDKTLSSSEVSDLYNGGNGPINLKEHSSTKDNLIGWWRCGDNDDDTGTTITDQSDEGRDGILVNTVSIVSGSGNFPPIT